ncbi:MAG: RidA family protein [Clostridiales bacterium]|nr:RidA family protein [Clostridiales bacterium]
MKTIHTEQAPAAIGPYSQAMISGGLVFTSGQIPVDPVSGEIVAADIILQTEQVMKNLAAVLAAAGSGFDRAIKATCYLANMEDFDSFNVVYSKYMTSRPARSCVAVKQLPKHVLCEVEVVAEV